MSSIVKTKNGQFLVTIPVELAKALKIVPGERVKWVLMKGNRIEMVREE